MFDEAEEEGGGGLRGSGGRWDGGGGQWCGWEEVMVGMELW